MADLGGRTIAVTRAETQLGEARRMERYWVAGAAGDEMKEGGALVMR